MKTHALAIVAFSAWAACDAPSPAPAGAPSSSVAAAPSAASAAPSAAAPPAPAPTFALAETPADRLGTAPDGFGLKVGTKAPDASLPDVDGTAQSLAAMFAKGPVLVIFYRGGWCPFCNLQMHEYAKAKPDFERRGVGLVAISVDKPSEEAKTQAKQGIAFPMLSDSKLEAHRAYHVVHTPDAAEREKLAGYGIDLAAYSGESHGEFAVPAIFLVDKGGVVRFVHVDPDYKTRPSAKQMLSVVDTTLGAK